MPKPLIQLRSCGVSNRSHDFSDRMRGFSLVELMVGMALALIAVIVVMQIFSLSETNRRTTAGGDAAFMDGAIAVTDLERDLRQSGMGASNLVVMGCSLTIPVGAKFDSLGPVTINPSTKIVPAGDANTDTLLIVYSNDNGSPEGDAISGVVATTTYDVNTPTAFAKNDYVIAATQVQPAGCALVLDQVVTSTGTTQGSPVTVKTGSSSSVDTLYNWGQSPRVVAYRVSSGRLQQCDFMQNDCTSTSTAGAWVDLLDGVVSLRAQYGRDTSASMDGEVDTYDQTTPTTACGWARTSTLRLALTLRNGEQEKVAVTSATAGSAPLPTWSGSATTPIDVSGLANWSQFRYKVFESVVPMRNMVWIGGQSTCNSVY